MTEEMVTAKNGWIDIDEYAERSYRAIWFRPCGD